MANDYFSQFESLGDGDYFSQFEDISSKTPKAVRDATWTEASKLLPGLRKKGALPDGVQLTPLQAELIAASSAIDEMGHGIQQLAGKGYSALGLPGAESVGRWSQANDRAAMANRGAIAQASQQQPGAARGGKILGTVARSLPLTPLAMGGGAAMNALGMTGGGAVEGGLLYAAPDESRLKNILEGGAYGAAGAGLGLGVGALAKGVSALANPATRKTIVEGVRNPVKGAKKVFEATRKSFGYTDPKQLAEQIANTDPAKWRQTLGEGYDSIWETTKSAGVTKAKIKQFDAGNFFQDASSSEAAAITKAFKTQKLTDIHEAIKDLNTYIRGVKSAAKKGKLSKVEKDALKEAINMRKNFNDSLKGSLKKVDPALVKKFEGLNKQWRARVVKPETNPLLERYRQGDIKAERLIPELHKQPSFEANLADFYPQVAKNKHINVGLGIAGAGLLPATGLTGGLLNWYFNR